MRNVCHMLFVILLVDWFVDRGQQANLAELLAHILIKSFCFLKLITTMTKSISRCPHVATIGVITTEDYLNAIRVR